MRKLFISMALIAALAGASATSAFAQETNTAKQATNAAHATRLQTVFRGTVASVDTTAKSVTLQGPKKQVVLITSQTKIIKDNKPGTFDTIAVGDRVQGSLAPSTDGKLEAKTFKIVTLKAAPGVPAPHPATAGDSAR